MCARPCLFAVIVSSFLPGFELRTGRNCALFALGPSEPRTVPVTQWASQTAVEEMHFA